MAQPLVDRVVSWCRLAVRQVWAADRVPQLQVKQVEVVPNRLGRQCHAVASPHTGI